MQTGLTHELTDTPDPAAREAIHAGIVAFNDETSIHHRQARQTDTQSLDIYLRDADGRLLGGLLAETYWGWLAIQDFWLVEELRGQNWGRKMLALLEAEAIARGCGRAWLRTFSFQARGFYEKQGYRVVGALEDYPPGHTFYWLRKDFADPA